MNLILAILGVAIVVFYAIAVAVLKSKLARWLRITLAAPLLAIAIFGGCVFLGLVWDYYGRPTENTAVSQLQEISQNHKIDVGEGIQRDGRKWAFRPTL